jgi:protein required for attachment to host cells
MPRQYTRRPSARRPRNAVWILAADAGRARLFEAQARNGALAEIEDVINADARLRDLDLVSDRTGHANRGGVGAGNTFEPRQWHLDRAAEMFAKSLCRRLADGRRKGAVGRVYLLADPGFLGLLRKNLDRPTQRIVAGQDARDLTRRPAKVIRQALPAVL